MRISTRARRALSTVAAAAILAAGTLLGATSASAAPALPTRMAALGDSITQASMTCSVLIVCPTNSWSTGSSAAVASHASRLRAAGAPLATVNLAVPGATSSALPTQALRAVASGAQYVTIEIGANDACASTVAGMTATATYAANVQAALTALAAGAAHPQIFVASVPNLKRMWEVNAANPKARLAWALLTPCSSLLKNPTSMAAADVQRRDAVQQRVDEYNVALAAACAATANCRFDGAAVANYVFSAGDISTRDYFHPSISGQATLASLTWTASQFGS